MSSISNDCGCSCGTSGCCAPSQGNKKLTIDFLYLDLNTCERCMGTDQNLDESLKEVSGVLSAAGFDLLVNKVNINTKELACQYEFVSSPTIRINGKDIALELKESTCKDCGDICGDQVDCRVWTYNGEEYNSPPKELIINAILKEIYGGGSSEIHDKKSYQLPENLRVFFEGSKQFFEKCPVCESEPMINKEIEIEDHACVFCGSCGFFSEPVPLGPDLERRLQEEWRAAINDYHKMLIGMNFE